MEEKIPLSADHSLMVKFDSRDSKGYRVIVNRLKKFEKEAAQNGKREVWVCVPYAAQTLLETRVHPIKYSGSRINHLQYLRRSEGKR